MKHKLEVDSIFLEFGLRQILTDIYFRCDTGSITGLLGRNGEGKSSLMNIVYGSLKTTSKSVRFDDITIYESFKRTDLLTYLPQFNFIPGSLSLKRIFVDFDISFNDFEAYFPEFKKRQNMRIGNLSGGERRLVEVYAISRSGSQFTMLDEPFSHLTPIHIEKIKEILITEKAKKGFLITDHMYRDITDICDSLYVLANGKTHLTKTIGDIEKLGYLKPGGRQ